MWRGPPTIVTLDRARWDLFSVRPPEHSVLGYTSGRFLVYIEEFGLYFRSKFPSKDSVGQCIALIFQFLAKKLNR